MATKADVRLEDLLGRVVRGQDGGVIGRLEEFRAEREGEHWVVTRYHIGPAALLERLAVRHLGVTWRSVKGYEARWDQLSLDDPQRPTLTCDRADLKAIRR